MSSGKKKSLAGLLDKVAVMTMMLVFGYYLLCVLMVSGRAYGIKAFVCGWAVLALLAPLVVFLSGKVRDDTTSSAFVFCASVLCLLVWDLYVKATPVSDYEVLWRGAARIADGTFRDEAIRLDSYFCFYSFQIPYTYYLSIIVRLFHGSLAAARAVQAVVMSLTNVVLLKTLRLYTDRKIAISGSIIYLLWPYISMGGVF